MKKILIIVSIILIANNVNAQFVTDKVSKENKFFLKSGKAFFASYDENFINDSLISGYTVKDIRGMVIANVLFKVGKMVDDASATPTLMGYTEVLFTKSNAKSQQLGFICADAAAGVFEELLYDSASAILAGRKFTYQYELDYTKVEKFTTQNNVICTDKIDPFYNPIADYNNLVLFFKKATTCVKKSTTKVAPKAVEPAKIIAPKK